MTAVGSCLPSDRPFDFQVQDPLANCIKFAPRTFILTPQSRAKPHEAYHHDHQALQHPTSRFSPICNQRSSVSSFLPSAESRNCANDLSAALPRHSAHILSQFVHSAQQVRDHYVPFVSSSIAGGSSNEECLDNPFASNAVDDALHQNSGGAVVLDSKNRRLPGIDFLGKLSVFDENLLGNLDYPDHLKL
ncbi:MAG: hypothetical protein MHMPM18_000275 [Marteilia pararefringens]